MRQAQSIFAPSPRTHNALYQKGETMTDAEREAQIRNLIEVTGKHETPTSADVYQRTYLDLCFLTRLLDEARAEIARLQAPPGASAMERAQRMLDEFDRVALRNTDSAMLTEWIAHAIEAAVADERMNWDTSRLTETIDAANTARNYAQAHAYRLEEELREARDEIARLKAERERIGEFLEGISDLMPPLGDSRRRLQAPPGASAMERAEKVMAEWDDSDGQNPQTWHEIMARAIEQAEREARAAALKIVRQEFDDLIVPASSLIGWSKIVDALDEIADALSAKSGDPADP